MASVQSEHSPLVWDHAQAATSHHARGCKRPSWGQVAAALWGVSALLVVALHGHPWWSTTATSSTSSATSSSQTPRFDVSFASTVHPGPITGRLLLCVATPGAVEDDPWQANQPRFLISDDTDTQQLFARDVAQFHAGTETRALSDADDAAVVGYPLRSLRDVPVGPYWVQAVLVPYVHYNRSDGHSLWLPGMQTFESELLSSPGSLYSAPQLVTFDGAAQAVHLILDAVVAPLPLLANATAASVETNRHVSERTSSDNIDTSDNSDPVSEQSLLQHVRVRNERLSSFWGTDVFLQAWVLLPHKFFAPETAHIRYPLFIYHTHYSREFEGGFQSEPPRDMAHASLREQYAHYLYRNWTSDADDALFRGRRGIIVQLQHANPYYDDSYAVNSANIGPYGDAITFDFIPYVESAFRGIGAGWARTTYGGSTGGWESLAVQVFYPDEYNGCWSFCPDSFDFRKFQLVDLLHDKNAYYTRGEWTQKELGSRRDYLGHIRETMALENHHELARGSRGRSGGQWDAWQAVYSPVNASDGFPAAIWDKQTGDIHPEVVAHWETHYDVRAKLQREWESQQLGAKLENKLHVFVGVLDSYYLNDGVYYLEEFLESTTRPYYNGSIVYGVEDGKGFEHCWTGSFDEPLSLARHTVNQRMIPQMIAHLVQSAPPNASLDFTSY